MDLTSMLTMHEYEPDMWDVYCCECGRRDHILTLFNHLDAVVCPHCDSKNIRYRRIDIKKELSEIDYIKAKELVNKRMVSR